MKVLVVSTVLFLCVSVCHAGTRGEAVVQFCDHTRAYAARVAADRDRGIPEVEHRKALAREQRNVHENGFYSTVITIVYAPWRSQQEATEQAELFCYEWMGY